jgi:hypothetical protein
MPQLSGLAAAGSCIYSSISALWMSGDECSVNGDVRLPDVEREPAGETPTRASLPISNRQGSTMLVQSSSTSEHHFGLL